ncbi:MAG: hypothetical protein LBV67_09435 [Streptococcaceae bacterium]|nr:hypothetical protein [Streptococcaceae bacterium]
MIVTDIYVHILLAYNAIISDKINYIVDEKSFTYRPSSIVVGNVSIDFLEDGRDKFQDYIDSSGFTNTCTFGGTDVFSGTDGLNTAIGGHNPGVFHWLVGTSIGARMIVTDNDGISYEYYLKEKLFTDDKGNDLKGSDKNFYDFLTGKGDEERITIMYCVDDDRESLIFVPV